MAPVKGGMDGEMWNGYMIEYYSAIKKNEILPSAAKWMELEDGV